MYKIEDKYGKEHGIFKNFKDAKQLAVSLGSERLHQLMEYSHETNTELRAEMGVEVYNNPYNGEKGVVCFHVYVGDYDNNDDFVEENYFDVTVED